MSKPGRNDPCPCGSGKKYKKCCGKNNVVAFDTTLYTNELERLQQELITFIFDEHEDTLIGIAKDYTEELYPATNEEEIDLCIELVIGWAIFTVPVHNEKTLFNLFYDKVKDKIRYPAVKKAFANWSAAESGFFEIYPADDGIDLKDLMTGKWYKVTRDDEQDYERGNLAIGTLIPYVNTYEFFLTMIQVQKSHASPIPEAPKLPDDLKMKDLFPTLLVDLFKQDSSPATDMNEFSWEDYDHAAVAYMFKEHATKKGYDKALIQITMQFWSDYCQLRYPTIRKYAAHAAALDYFSQVEFLPFTDVTQTQLAKEYGTSPGTISNHYGRLADEFDILKSMADSDISTSQSTHMEKEIRDMTRWLEKQEFESEEELNDFLQSGISFDDLPKSEEPRDIAQDYLFEAGEASGAKRKQLVQKALNVYPLSPDAYLLLAEDERDMNKRINLLKNAVDVGEQDLGQAFFKENRGHFWGLIETRPYMRAKATYGETLESLGLTKKAIDVYADLLELNPNDNQGIRYALLPLYIMEGHFAKAHTLLEAYDEDSTTILFNKALLHYKENGVTTDGINVLMEANASNPHVIDFLLGKKRIPNERPNYVGFGDDNEAIVYVQDNAHFWKRVEDFLEMV